MSTFTGRELEFLTGLNRSWWTLYCKELARLQRNEDAPSNAQQEIHAGIQRSESVVHRSAKILAFAQNAP
jgi:hypothetical protein